MRPTQKKNRILFICANLLIALFGCIRVFRATRWGVWAFSDSASYFSAARNWIAGQGMIIQQAGRGSVIYQQFPPLYPFALGLGTWAFGDIFAVARWINILAFSAFLYLAGENMAGLIKKPLPSLILPLALLLSPNMVTDFTGAMTEPIFLVLVMASFLLVRRLILSPQTRHLVWYMLVSALLPLTRFSGVSIVAANTLLLFLFMPALLKKRFWVSATSALTSALPIFLWTIYLYRVTENVGGRSVQLASSFAENFQEALRLIHEVLRTFLPYQGYREDLIASGLRLNLFVFLLAVLIVAAVCKLIRDGSRSLQRMRDTKIFLIFVLQALAFFVFIAFSYSITLASYRIDQRQLSPLIPFVWMVVISALWIIRPRGRAPHLFFPLVCALALAIVLRYTFFSSGNLVRELHENGSGFTARQYQQSGIIEAIRKIPAGTPIISNSAGFILLHDNRLPIQVNQFPIRRFGKRDTYGERTFRERGAPLVLFLPDFHNAYGERSEEWLAAVTDGLRLDYQDAVSAIYYYPVD